MVRISIVSLLLTIFSFSTLAQKFLFVTEDLPPFQIQNEDKLPSGVLVELIEAIIADAGLEAEIAFYPWARSYEIAQTTPNTFIFSMLRNKKREKEFVWVGKLLEIKSYLAKLKSRSDIKVTSIEDAKSYSVGTIRHDSAETYLLDKGFSPEDNLYVSAKYSVLWQMLYSGRTDIAFTNSIVWPYEIRESGLDPNQVELVYEVKDTASELYLATNLATPKDVISRVKTSLESIKKDGRYDKIIAKWNLTN